MVSLMTQLGSWDVKLVPMMSNDQKSHVAPYFHHFDLRNTVVPLKMPLVSLDGSTDTNGVT